MSVGKCLALSFGVLFVLCGCKELIKKKDSPLFIAVQESHSHIGFSNDITEEGNLNYYNFPYIYMGGGVGIGDFNKDGLPDIYVTGNMVENKLYLNKGNLVFEDITVKAGVAGNTNKWYTGVSIVDINADGWLDIYVSVSGLGDKTNELYINKGDLTFVESAESYGIADSSASIQATFFDYNNDGFNDLYVANYPLVPLSMGPNFYAQMMAENRSELSAHLYMNTGKGIFIDKTQEAGVQNFGLTLGVVASDINNDGFVDLYASNDFNVPDYLYINKGDGSFREASKNAFRHTSMFGMGIDISDFNNDGLQDILQVDMTPEDYKRSKTNMASMNPESFWDGVNLGLHYQYMQNSLQLNNGIDEWGTPIFSEISRMAGIATTDWSWSALFVDLDNNGWKDIYVTNGIKRDVNNNDMNKRTSATSFKEAYSKLDLKEYPSEPISNYAFLNQGSGKFKNVTDNWGLTTKGFSNGMAYADLDVDGDLDLVINNIDQVLSVYKNESSQKENAANYLKIQLEGPMANPMGLGAKVVLKHLPTQQIQMTELTLTRGFQSSVDPVMHFGLGGNDSDFQLEVIWPDGNIEVKEINTVNQTLVINYSEERSKKDLYARDTANKKQLTVHKTKDEVEAQRFRNISDKARIDFVHTEDYYNDYALEPLLPHKYSTLGPALAIGDVNADGLEDFFIGNAANAKSRLYVQLYNGDFQKLEGPWESDSGYEDVGAVFFDADSDGDNDLYVVSGGNDPNADFQDRLYLNTESGFVKSEALPEISSSGRALCVSDYDHDGDMDIFLGGRIVPGRYGQNPESLILKNLLNENSSLAFQKVVIGSDSENENLGMVTDAIWVDLDEDGWEDLVITGEWMAITVFSNNEGILTHKKQNALNEKKGWWYGLQSIDVDLDGDYDLIAGNLGLNYKYQALAKKPFELFLNDFDANGKEDIVFGVHKKNQLVPLRGRECSSQQIPGIAAKYTTYGKFASADLGDIYGETMLNRSVRKIATDFAHYWLENDGSGNFIWHRLPTITQISPISSIVPIDYNGDDYLDLLVTGSIYDAEVETPRADASVGLILENNEGAGFTCLAPAQTGLLMPYNNQQVGKINLQPSNATGLLFAGSNEPARLIEFKN